MRQSKLRVAVTGGIGSGKSTVLRLIGELGYPVFSADAIGRRIYEDEAVLRAVRARFPRCMCGDAVDRKALSKVVFSDPEALQALDGITHPAIMRRLRDAMDAAPGPLAFAEVPLLFESGTEGDFDRVIVVRRPKEARIRSVVERDGLTRAEVLARMQNQFDYEKNSLDGHTVIENDSGLAALRAEVERVVHAIALEAEQR